MSSIITSILSSTVGLLVNKARDTTANKLKDGDVTDAKLREVVVRELNDVKSKLDGLSRKDLLSSYCFLKEGVGLLNDSLDQSKLVNEGNQSDCDETSRMPSFAEAGILSEALELPNTWEKLKINSEKELEKATKRFEDARKRATDAFCNESLSVQDRVFAAKLRVVTEILECIETPETAITGCLSFLHELHSLPAIREMFSVHLNRGLKSWLNKAERVENVKSIMLINYVLYQLNSKFSRKLSNRVTWPGLIELGDRNFNPIEDWKEVSTRKSWGDELIERPNRLIFGEKLHPHPVYSAVNSRREIVTRYNRTDIAVMFGTGEIKVITFPDPGESGVARQVYMVVGLAVDHKNNVYVVGYFRKPTRNGVVQSYVLGVYDEHYNLINGYPLDFNFFNEASHGAIAVNKNNDIILIKVLDPHVYVFDNTGQLKYKFERDSVLIRRICVTDQMEILIESGDRKAVNIYAEKGDLKSVMKVPEGHIIKGMAFHHVMRRTILLTFLTEQNSYFLFCFSLTGELESSTFLCNKDSGNELVSIKSHPSGPLAIFGKKSISFI